MIDPVTGERWHDRIEVNAARALFRLGHAGEFRITNIAQTRHMLYWLGVLLDADSPRF